MIVRTYLCKAADSRPIQENSFTETFRTLWLRTDTNTRQVFHFRQIIFLDFSTSIHVQIPKTIFFGNDQKLSMYNGKWLTSILKCFYFFKHPILIGRMYQDYQGKLWLTYEPIKNLHGSDPSYPFRDCKSIKDSSRAIMFTRLC